MEVTKFLPTALPGSAIEIGVQASGETKVAVRFRYNADAEEGEQIISKEVPLLDLIEMMCAVADEDLLIPAEIARVIGALSDSLKRQI